MSFDVGQIQKSVRDLSSPRGLSAREILADIDAASIATTMEEWNAWGRYRQVLRELGDVVKTMEALKKSIQGLEGEALERARIDLAALRKREREVYCSLTDMERTSPISEFIGRVNVAAYEVDFPLCQKYPNLSYRERLDAIAYYLRKTSPAPVSSAFRPAPPQDRPSVKYAASSAKQEDDEDKKNNAILKTIGIVFAVMFVFALFGFFV